MPTRCAHCDGFVASSWDHSVLADACGMSVEWCAHCRAHVPVLHGGVRVTGLGSVTAAPGITTINGRPALRFDGTRDN
jgi:hypothetical protein